MTETEALAICFRNLKGSKAKALMDTAVALRWLRDNPKYGSNARVAQALGVSREMVREFLALLDLPPEVQQMLSDGRLKLEHGRRLAQLRTTRPDVVAETAVEMAGMTAFAGRDLARYLLTHPESRVPDAVAALKHARTVTTKEYHVIVPLSAEEFEYLKREARRVHADPTVLAGDWIRSHLPPRSDV